MGEWREVPLGEVIELKRGYDLPKRERIEGNVPLVSSSGVTDRHSVAMVKGPGVVTGRYGTLGQVFYIPEDYWPLNTTLYVCDFKGNDPRFISYLLGSIDFHAYSDKAAVPGLNRNHLHQALVRLPTDPSEQIAIASALAALDDKISLNARINETCDSLSRTLFRDWFVDFGPVHANESGKTRYLSDDIWDLFPQSFDAQGVPSGWPVRTWGDLATLEYGKRLEGYKDAIGDVPVYGTNGPIGWHDAALSSEAGIVIGRKGAYRGIHFSEVPFFVIDTAFYMKAKIEHSRRWAYYTLSRHDLDGMDSGSAIPSTSRDDFYQIPLVEPPFKLQQKFDEILQPIWTKQRANRSESDTLKKLRDSLLPQLLSGEVRFRKAEKTVEGAL